MIIRFIAAAFILFAILTGWTSTAAYAQSGNYTYLIYIKGLKASDIEGSELPNLKSLADNSISYANVSKPNPFPESLYTLFGGPNRTSSLPKTLSKNGVDCLLIDGSGEIPKNYCDQNSLDLISGTNDKDVLNQYFSLFPEKDYNFVTIYLDDINDSDTSETRRWSLVDNQIGLLLNYLINTKKIDKSYIFITGDTDQPPLLMFRYNPNFKANYYYCSLMDLGPTICKIYCINLPPGMSGNILYEFFINSTEPMSMKRIVDLQKQCLMAEEKINLLQKNNNLINADKIKIFEEKLIFDRKILEKEKQITGLEIKLKLFKIAAFLGLVILVTGYVIEYKVLRKKFLIFP
ncbi:hypothetical protein [Desulfotruncus alcoholivorax]|uniref:hypothetical protein n=1 Tax=Desulfotruncus alcoholivorax TaxID=265477 RepID=UPI0003FF0137|nr:hypothetical protein [Desulfotruncus alcoholivorax]